VPAAEEGSAGSDVSEWEFRERREREDELRAEAEVPCVKDEMGDGEGSRTAVPTHALHHGIGEQ